MEILRSAKSANYWSPMELAAYNITIERRSSAEFYDGFNENTSLDGLDPAILTTPVDIDFEFGDDLTISDISTRYLSYLSFARTATDKSHGIEFASQTMSLLGFEDREAVLFHHYKNPLTICGKTDMNSYADLVLLHLSNMILLVLVHDDEDKITTHSEAQVVAEAIAAYQSNNLKREARGLQPLERMDVPCLLMSGTFPTFYIVAVTEALNFAVMRGQYPQDETKVLRYAYNYRTCGSMGPLGYRQVVLQSFMAFKALAKSHWEKFLDGLVDL